MSDYILSPRALQDLAHIWDATFDKWGEEQADHYTDLLDLRCSWLAANPLLGKERDEVRKGLRSFPEGQHFVFYRVTDDGIEIVGFPYQRQELQQYFET